MTKSQLRSPLRAPRQLSIGFDSVPVCGVDPAERAKVLAALVSILIQAATTDTDKSSDDER